MWSDIEVGTGDCTFPYCPVDSAQEGMKHFPPNFVSFTRKGGWAEKVKVIYLGESVKATLHFTR